MLSRVDDLRLVLEEWRELAVAHGNMFLTPDWAMTWLSVYGERQTPSVRCARLDDRLVGVLPLTRDGRGTLRFAGDGAGDLFAPLVDRTVSADVVGALVESLRDEGNRLLVLTNVERDAPWRRRLHDELGRRGLVDRPQLLPFADLRELDWPGYLATRSANFRSQLGRKQRALEREHQVMIRRAESPAELEKDLATFFSLHDMGWNGRGSLLSASPRMRDFLMALCGRILGHGWLRLWTLELDGVPAATWLGWNVGGRYAYYAAGFDRRFAAHSPGFLLLAHTVREAIGEAAAEYDLLLGDEQYKGRFATSAREVETELIGSGRRLLVGHIDRGLRRLGRLLPPPLRGRARRTAAALERHLPLARHR